MQNGTNLAEIKHLKLVRAKKRKAHRQEDKRERERAKYQGVVQA